MFNTKYVASFNNGRLILNAPKVVKGLDLIIESPKDSLRHGPDWIQQMAHDYGYICDTIGNDGDEVDMFLGPNEDSDLIYIIDQDTPKGDFDEHKVMIGFSNIAEAKDAYFANYPEGWDQLRNINEIPVSGFWDWYEEHRVATDAVVTNGKLKILNSKLSKEELAKKYYNMSYRELDDGEQFFVDGKFRNQ